MGAELIVPAGLVSEVEGANLGDPRRNARLAWLVEHMAASPSSGFPGMVATESELEAVYRFLRNPYVSPEQILEPHHEATAKRARELDVVLVAHDTSEFKTPYQDQQDVGYLRGGQRGFLGHFALAIEPGDARRPLGVAGWHTWSREAARAPQYSKSGKKRKLTGQELSKLDDRESRRWGELVEKVEERFIGASVVHVMDREADSYELLAGLVDKGRRFVIRMCKNRNAFGLDDETARKLRDLLGDAAPILEREVRLSRRRKTTAPTAAKKQPEREARSAKLRCAATRVRLKRPSYLGAPLPPLLELNVVHVYEVGCPPGGDPVQWVLFTTEPVDTAEQVAWVIDAYRSRWLIEEFFKAVKTGCAYRKRQLESLATLLVALAVSSIVAWQLLLLRAHARAHPEDAADTVFTPGQLEALRKLSKQPLPQPLTIKAAVQAVARLGGHLRSNGQPGWLSLTKGIQKILSYVAGYHEAAERALSALAELGVLDQPGVKEALGRQLGAGVGRVVKHPTIDG